jgi:hypothetical protein
MFFPLNWPSFRKGVSERKNPGMIRNPRHRPDLFIPQPHRVLKVFFGTRPVGAYAFRVASYSVVKVFVGLPQGMRIQKKVFQNLRSICRTP